MNMKYTIHGKTYENLFLLGSDIYLFQEEFMANLRSDDRLFEEIQKEDPSKALRLKKLLKISQPDEILAFKAALILNPYINFSHRKKTFQTYQELGDYLLKNAPEEDPFGLEILHYNLVSLHLLFSHRKSEDPEFFQDILEIEHLSEKDINYAYFILSFYLSGKKRLRYYQKEYKDIYSLLYYLKRERKDEASLAIELSHSPYLRAYSRFSDERKEIETFLHLNEELDKSAKKLDVFLKKREESISSVRASLRKQKP